MHPFCCAPLVPVSPAASSAAAAASTAAATGAPTSMPPPVPPPLPSPRSNSSSGERRVRVAGAGGSGGGSSPPEGVKLNEIVGGGISGILYKWVNYGRGWRPRWFALHDGVLSYYKIHGPDRIVLSRETERGAKVIGEDSIRRLSRPYTSPSSSHSNGHHQPRKPFGEIHLKVVIGFCRASMIARSISSGLPTR
jgi:oxysterol-binding protein 1